MLTCDHSSWYGAAVTYRCEGGACVEDSREVCTFGEKCFDAACDLCPPITPPCPEGTHPFNFNGGCPDLCLWDLAVFDCNPDCDETPFRDPCDATCTNMYKIDRGPVPAGCVGSECAYYPIGCVSACMDPTPCQSNLDCIKHWGVARPLCKGGEPGERWGSCWQYCRSNRH